LLVGPTGSGKSHLTYGLAERWARRPGSPQVTYLSAPDFRRQLDQAIAARSTASFRQQLRASELLVIDDLHKLPTASYVQEEFLNTLDALPADCRLLVTSSQMPVAIPGLLTAVSSRLAGGLILQLAPLGRQARAELLGQYLSELDRTLEPAALELFATRVEGEAPQVLRAAAELCAVVPRHETVDEAQMKRFLDARVSRCRTTVEDIVKLVARYHKLSPRMIASSTRRRALVEARGVVVYLARRLLGTSFEQLGQALGGRDHSTIMHSFHKIEETLPRDPQLKSSIEELQRLLRAA
jgi:chromosomal replication initiator protein